MADDHAVLRQGLASILENEDDFAVIGHPADGREAVRLAAELSPDVVLMDITMPNMDGIEATACIVKSHPDIRIVGLSMHEDGGMKERMIKAGAAAYVYKEAAAETLEKAIPTGMATKGNVPVPDRPCESSGKHEI